MASLRRNMGLARRLAFDAVVIGTLVIAFVGEGVVNAASLVED